MNLFFKFTLLIIKRLFWSKKQSILDECETSFYVDPFDLDLNFHMNNGKFFSIMDLGRFDLMIKTKVFFKLFLNGYYPIILSESMIFKKSLHLFEKYTLKTKVDCWDHNFFYFTQKFIKKDQIAASSSLRICFKKRGRSSIVPTKEVLNFLNIDDTKNNLSLLAKKQIELDSILLPRN